MMSPPSTSWRITVPARFSLEALVPRTRSGRQLSAVLRNAQGMIQIDNRRVEPARSGGVRCPPVLGQKTPVEGQQVTCLLEVIGEAQVVDHSQGPTKNAH